VHSGLLLQQPGNGKARGLYSTVDIGPNETLVRVPISTILTVPHCLKNSPLTAAVNDLFLSDGETLAGLSPALLAKMGIGEETSFWKGLRAQWRRDNGDDLDRFLLSLCLMEAEAQGASSIWAPWLAMLPQNHAGAPLAMKSQDLHDCVGSLGFEIVDAADRWKTTKLDDYLLLSKEVDYIHSYGGLFSSASLSQY
jgi:hypothetical protein